MKPQLLLLVISAFFLAQCQGDRNVICTENFAFIAVSIKDTENAPVALDSFKVIRARDNVDVTLKYTDEEFGLMQKTGSYPITNDLHKQQLFQKNEKLIFLGSKQNKIIVNERYTATADECHVKLVEGRQSLVID